MNNPRHHCGRGMSFDSVHMGVDEVELAYTAAFGNEPKNDIVNHPTHYCRDDAMECIEEMELIFGKEAVKHFCLCNAWKYRYRSSAKNGEEDIKKSDWYIRKYKELTTNG
jgi:hypothetical protein